MESEAWWDMPLIPTYRRLKQVDLYEFEASLVYTEASPRPARVTALSIPAL